MTSSPSNSKADGYDFPFQFMLDSRSSPMNCDSPPKGGPKGTLTPFQWFPPDSSSRLQKFMGDIADSYNGPNMFQDNDSFSFFDQSFFFMDGYEQQPGPVTPHATIPRDSQHRVSFSSRLTKCHRQRMSTIAEYPVKEDDYSTEEEGDSNHEAESAIATQLEWDFRTEQSGKSSFQKLLDHIVPYPTRRVRGKLTKQNKLKPSFAIVLPRGSSIRTTDSSSTNTSDSSPLDDEWVAHGFIEICKKAIA